MKTVDGFPVQDNFNFLAEVDPGLNPWSVDKQIKIPVVDFYFNPRWLTHKGQKIYVLDYELAIGMIKNLMRGCTDAEAGIKGFMKRPTMTKEEALDHFFEIPVYPNA